MDNINIRDLNLIELVNYLSIASENNDQHLINMIAYELAYRIYVPNKGIAFDDLLTKFGYKELNDLETKMKTR